jgi:hypothetical protein
MKGRNVLMVVFALEVYYRRRAAEGAISKLRTAGCGEGQLEDQVHRPSGDVLGAYSM